jgi:hypothetical protein
LPFLRKTNFHNSVGHNRERIKMIENFQLLQAIKKRRNENAEGARRREYAKELFKKYFSLSGNSAGETLEQNENFTSL